MPTNPVPDGRTREGQKELIRRAVRVHKGYSIFWITETQKRACAATAMVESGELITTPDRYPWIRAEIKEETSAN